MRDFEMDTTLDQSTELVNASDARQEELAGISEPTLWRWERDPKLNFPPAIRINGRKYWTRKVLRRWVAERREPDDIEKKETPAQHRNDAREAVTESA